MTTSNVFRITLVILLTLLGAYIIVSSFRILIVLTIAFIIASAVRPIVQTLLQWRVPAGLAIGLTYLTLISVAILISIVVLPPIFQQLIGYFENDDRLANQIISAQIFFQNLIRSYTNNEIVTISTDNIRTNVALFVQQIRDAAPMAANNVGGIAGDLVLVFVIGVYWLTSRDKSIEFMTTISPTLHKGKVAEIVTEIESTMGSYVRGVLTIASIVTLLNFIPMLILGVPNALLLSVIVGITTTIPMIGGIIGGAIVVLLTLLVSYEHVLTVLIIFLIIQQIENNFLSPRIMSSRVGLDPMLVIVYSAIGLVMGGVLGALLAIPVMAIMHVFLKHFVISPRIIEISEFANENGVTVIKDRREEKDKHEEDVHVPAESGKILIASGSFTRDPEGK